MKTAISIPTPLFQAAERRARKLGLSRNHLYAKALERLVDHDPDQDITLALEAVYSKERASIYRGLAAAQRRATAEKWWRGAKSGGLTLVRARVRSRLGAGLFIPKPDPDLRQYVEKRSKPSTLIRGA